MLAAANRASQVAATSGLATSFARSAFPALTTLCLKPRTFSSMGSGESFAELDEQWPTRKINTVLNIVPQGVVHVVERFGKLSNIQYSGMYVAVPLIDRISYVIDMRERALEIHPQQAISRDNVSLSLDGVVFVRVVDPELCAYGARRPFFAVRQHAQSVMRAAIGRRTMEDAFHDRSGLNADIKEEIADSAAAWGLEVMRYEVLNIEADATVARAMDLQATAERKRREEIITAEATKRREILEAEGRAQAVERQAEAERQASILRAQGQAESVRLAAHAERERRVQLALGEAEALSAVGKGLVQENGVAAAHVKLAEDYMRMMGQVGSRSNTMFFSGGGAGGLGSLEEMAAKVAAVFNSTKSTVPKVAEDPSQSVEALDMSTAERYGHVNHVEDEEEDFLSNKYASTKRAPTRGLSGSTKDALKHLEESSVGGTLLGSDQFKSRR